MTVISTWPYRVPEKLDPNATLDYVIDWSDWLAEDESLADSTWEITNATQVYASFTTTTATVWVSDPLDTITAVNTITTNSAPIARVDERTLIIKIKDK